MQQKQTQRGCQGACIPAACAKKQRPALTRRPKQEGPKLVGPPGAAVVLGISNKAVQLGQHRLLDGAVQGNGVEGGWVGEGLRLPHALGLPEAAVLRACVGVHLARASMHSQLLSVHGGYDDIQLPIGTSGLYVCLCIAVPSPKLKRQILAGVIEAISCIANLRQGICRMNVSNPAEVVLLLIQFDWTIFIFIVLQDCSCTAV